MNKAVLNSLTEAERNLIAETESKALAELDEDELLELHTRVRRARTKYVKLYRQGARSRVRQHGGRGYANPKSQRNRDKAEIFEDALARVSRQVARAAKQTAAELRTERLEAARSGRRSGPQAGPPAGGRQTGPGRRPAARKTTGGLKKDASTRAKGARRQAQRDSR